MFLPEILFVRPGDALRPEDVPMIPLAATPEDLLQARDPARPDRSTLYPLPALFAAALLTDQALLHSLPTRHDPFGGLTVLTDASGSESTAYDIDAITGAVLAVGIVPKEPTAAQKVIVERVPSTILLRINTTPTSSCASSSCLSSASAAPTRLRVVAIQNDKNNCRTLEVSVLPGLACAIFVSGAETVGLSVRGLVQAGDAIGPGRVERLLVWSAKPDANGLYPLVWANAGWAVDRTGVYAVPQDRLQPYAESLSHATGAAALYSCYRQHFFAQ